MFAFSDTRPVRFIAPPVRRPVVLASELTLAEAPAYDQFVATVPPRHYGQTCARTFAVVVERAVDSQFYHFPQWLDERRVSVFDIPPRPFLPAVLAMAEAESDGSPGCTRNCCRAEAPGGRV